MAGINRINTLAAAFCLAFAINAGAPVMAQSQKFEAEKLQSFAVAALQVQQISMAVQQQMTADPSPEKKKNVQTQAAQQMVQAIQSEGLSVNEYKEIADAAQSDPELATQIKKYMADKAE